MGYRVAAYVEILILCILVVVALGKGLRVYSNWKAHSAAVKGINLIELGKDAVAREQFKKVAKARPLSPVGHQSLLYLALKKDPIDNKEVKTYANTLLKLTGKAGHKAAAAHIAFGILEGNKALKARNSQEALKLLDAADRHFRNAYKADPDSADASGNRGIVSLLRFNHRKDKKYLEAAYKYFERDLKKAKSISFHMLYPLTAATGRLYFEWNQPGRALDEMTKSAEMDLSQTDGLTNLAIAYSRRLQSAALSENQKRALIQKAVKVIPTENPAYMLLNLTIGKALFEMGQFGEANQYFGQVENQFEDHAMPSVNKGAYEFVTFQRSVNRSRPLGPVSTAFKFLYAAVYEKKHITPEAKSWCLNLMAYCCELGYPFTKKNAKPVEAKSYYLLEALRLDPSNWAAARNLGILHQRNKEWKEALQYYLQSIRYKPTQDAINRAIRQFQEKPRIVLPPFAPPILRAIPEERGITTDELPGFIVTVRPSYPGKLDIEATRIWIDETPQKSWKFVTDNDLVIVTQQSLEDGPHLLKAKFVDAGGNIRDFVWEFAIDLNPPMAKFSSLKEGANVHPEKVFRLDLSDTASGVDYKSIIIYLDPVNTKSVPTSRIVNKGQYVYDMHSIKHYKKEKIKKSRIDFTLPPRRPEGSYKITVEVKDNAGRRLKSIFMFQLVKPEE